MWVNCSAYCFALGALLCKFVLVALHADYIVPTRDKALSTNRLLALGTEEAFLMPCSAFVLILSHCCFESLPATVAAGRKLFVETVRAEDGFVLCSKWPISQGSLALHANKTAFVPVPVLKGEILH